jgi:DNA-binding response OmpR family regulator
LRILVVEDDTDTANSLGLLLRLWGYDIRVCYQASAARALADGYRPHVVLLDIGLPGMNGYELARRLRGSVGAGRAVLIAVTGYGSDTDCRRATAAGCGFHLTKPVDPDELHGLLTDLERDLNPEQRRDDRGPMEPPDPIRALVADVDEPLLKSYQESLAAAGFAVVTVANGLECLVHLRCWRPDVLVLGDELPWGGSSGILALMAEEPDVAEVPVVVLLAGAASVPCPSSVRACLAKPVAPADLARTVRALVDERCDCPRPVEIWR